MSASVGKRWDPAWGPEPNWQRLDEEWRKAVEAVAAEHRAPPSLFRRFMRRILDWLGEPPL